MTWAATCTEDGIKTFTCSYGASYTEAIVKTGHSWGNWVVTKKAATETEYSQDPTCSVCGIGKIRVVILAQATCTLRGAVVGQCDHCGNIAGHGFPPAMGHTMVDGVCSVCGATETTCGLFLI